MENYRQIKFRDLMCSIAGSVLIWIGRYFGLASPVCGMQGVRAYSAGQDKSE